ncbi:MAG TPA: TetR/AcrR family transcriptional regulator [Terriglobales bacterium]|nr:TetR/AcrR family transcriptional regulator [Terriglobales bacterium]
MSPSSLKSPPRSARSAEQTRAAILQAALHEFASQGVAGARTDAIARAAKVNKALLYYYFKDKEALYGAVIDQVFSGLMETLDGVLALPVAPGEKLLRCVGAHFDFASSSPMLPRLMQHEMLRAGLQASPHLKHIAQTYFRPTFGRLAAVLVEGVRAGEFRNLDPAQTIPSMIGVVVHYFSSLPVITAVLEGDPLTPERLARRRAAVLDFVAAAIFRDPARAQEMLQRVGVPLQAGAVQAGAAFDELRPGSAPAQLGEKR